jgi:hypothetical protein
MAACRCLCFPDSPSPRFPISPLGTRRLVSAVPFGLRNYASLAPNHIMREEAPGCWRRRRAATGAGSEKVNRVAMSPRL